METRQLARAITAIVGPKGGVGKSLLAHSVIDWLITSHHHEVLVIDGDTDNTDVAKVHANLTPEPKSLNLDLREGWLALGDACGEYPAAHVIINTGARSLDALTRYSAHYLNQLAEHGRRPVVMLWTIDHNVDSLLQLRTYLDAEPTRRFPIHVACNEGKTEGVSFERYRESETAKKITDAGGHVFTVPTIAERITKPLYNARTPLHVLAGDDPAPPVPLGNRMEVGRLRGVVWPALEALWPPPPEC